MRIVIYKLDGPPVEIEAHRVRVMCGQDHFEMREQNGLLVRLEEHNGGLAMDLALFPAGANGVRLKGGL